MTPVLEEKLTAVFASRVAANVVMYVARIPAGTLFGATSIPGDTVNATGVLRRLKAVGLVEQDPEEAAKRNGSWRRKRDPVWAALELLAEWADAE